MIVLYHKSAMEVAVKLGSRKGVPTNPSFIREDCAKHSQDFTFNFGSYFVGINGYEDFRLRDKPFVPYEFILLFAPETDASHDLLWAHNLQTIPDFKHLRHIVGDFCSKAKNAVTKHLPHTHVGGCENHALQIIKRKCTELSTKKAPGAATRVLVKKGFYLNEFKSMLDMNKTELKEKRDQISNGTAQWDSRMVTWWDNPNSKLRSAALLEMNKESLVDAGFRPGFKRSKVDNNKHEGDNNAAKIILRELTGLHKKKGMAPHKFVRASHTWAHSMYNRVLATLREEYPVLDFGGPSNPKWIIPEGMPDEGICYDRLHSDTRTWAQARLDFVLNYEKASNPDCTHNCDLTCNPNCIGIRIGI